MYSNVLLQLMKVMNGIIFSSFLILKYLSVIPKPPPPFCEVSGRKYKDGESMEVLKNNVECHQCECIGGKVDHCHHIFHCSLNGSDCDRFEQIPGQCCPQCSKFGYFSLLLL